VHLGSIRVFFAKQSSEWCEWVIEQYIRFVFGDRGVSPGIPPRVDGPRPLVLAQLIHESVLEQVKGFESTGHMSPHSLFPEASTMHRDEPEKGVVVIKVALEPNLRMDVRIIPLRSFRGLKFSE